MKTTRSSAVAAVFLALFATLCCIPPFPQDGTVVVYRPGKFTGSALKPSVYVDGNQVARLSNGRYFSVRLAPGKHTFESSMKKEAPLEVEVKSDETVYLEMVILPGTWRGGGRLIPVGQEDAKAALLKLKPLDEKVAETGEQSTVLSAQPGDSSASGTGAAPQAESSPHASPASVSVKSTPEGADINVDGKFMGNTPSTIQLDAGVHQILIEKEGLKPWQRTMTVSSGGSITIDATLEKP